MPPSDNNPEPPSAPNLLPASVQEQIETLAAALETALDEIERLKQENKELKLALGKNSTNSSRPPSSDGPGAQSRGVRKKKKKPTGKRRGGQKGRRGAHRQLLPVEEVHEVIRLHSERCRHCGTELKPGHADDYQRHQTFELSRQGLEVIEFQRLRQTCPNCSKVTIEPLPAPWKSGIRFGPRLHAVIGMLAGIYHLSRRSVQRLLDDLLGLKISLGSISNIERRLTTSLEEPEQEIEAKLRSAAVRYTDGTSWLCGGELMSLWVLLSKEATLYRIFDDGQRETVRDMVAPHGKTITVSDRTSVLLFIPMHHRQICWAHLMRKFQEFSELGGASGKIGEMLLGYARCLFDYHNAQKSGKVCTKKYKKWIGKLRRMFMKILAKTQSDDYGEIRGSCKNLIKHAPALWTFLDRKDVEPTNNCAERELRPIVLWRRRCFGAQSDRGHRFASRVMSVAMTARKSEIRIVDYLEGCIVACFAGIPAPSMFRSSSESAT